MAFYFLAGGGGSGEVWRSFWKRYNLLGGRVSCPKALVDNPNSVNSVPFTGVNYLFNATYTDDNDEEGGDSVSNNDKASLIMKVVIIIVM